MTKFEHILFSTCCIPNTRYKPTKNDFTHAVLHIKDKKSDCIIDFTSHGVGHYSIREYNKLNDKWYYSPDMVMSGYVIETGVFKESVKNIVKSAKLKWNDVTFKNRKPYNCIAFSEDVIKMN